MLATVVTMAFLPRALFQVPPAPPQYPYLAAEINQMAKEDQAARQFFLSDTKPDKEKIAAIMKDLAVVDHRDTERMKWIVAKFGWPTPSMVGKEASNNAW